MENKIVNSHIVQSYDNELNSVHNLITRMSKLVREILEIAGKIIIDRDYSQVQLALSTDKKINEYDEEIESKATSLIVLRQPVAIDLRRTIAALKLAVILERMGDLAKQSCIKLSKVEVVLEEDLHEKIVKMHEMLMTMINSIIYTFSHSDDQRALEIFLFDQNVDNIYSEIMDMIKDRIERLPNQTLANTELIFAVKNLERIGDYIKKMASIIHYVITGQSKFSL